MKFIIIVSVISLGPLRGCGAHLKRSPGRVDPKHWEFADPQSPLLANSEFILHFESVERRRFVFDSLQ